MLLPSILADKGQAGALLGSGTPAVVVGAGPRPCDTRRVGAGIGAITSWQSRHQGVGLPPDPSAGGRAASLAQECRGSGLQAR